jgi:hypothetical protein
MHFMGMKCRGGISYESVIKLMVGMTNIGDFICQQVQILQKNEISQFAFLSLPNFSALCSQSRVGN